MMRDEQDPLRIDCDRFSNPVLHPQFVQQPSGHRLAKHAGRPRWCGKDRREDAFELDEWLLEEHGIVDVAARDAGLPQAERNRSMGKSEIVLDAGESLFL